MSKQFTWEEGKNENQIIIKQKQSDGKFRKILDLNMDNIPEFSEIWTEIQETIKIALETKIGNYQSIISMFNVTPAELGKTDEGIKTAPNNKMSEMLNDRQKIKDPKLIESKGDVNCITCGLIIEEKTQFFICPACGKPTHPTCGEDGVCTVCLTKA
jgi:predicted RNA-binding Zn-ribbon protein involved in translation (DUF1610 family)